MIIEKCKNCKRSVLFNKFIPVGYLQKINEYNSKSEFYKPKRRWFRKTIMVVAIKQHLSVTCASCNVVSFISSVDYLNR